MPTPIKCFLLDHGYTNQTSGPCCQIDDFKNLKDDQDRKVVTNFASLHQHPRYHEIKARMDRGEWDPACYRCKDPEDAGLESMRLNHDRWWKESDRAQGLANLTIWTGRECNLQCRSCHPYCSTSWSKEFQDLPDSLKIDMSYSNQEAKWIDQYAQYDPDDFQHVNSVILTGGEPLYNKQYFDLLHAIGDSTQGRCSLTMITNCTIAMDFEQFAFLKKYRDINLICSIDATGPAFEFIRTGGNWDRVERNIRSYKQSGMSLSYHLTHSVLNLFELDRTRRWLAEAGIGDCGLQTFVVQPRHISYSVLTPQEKESYVQWHGQQNFDADLDYVLQPLMTAEHDPILRDRFNHYMQHTKRFHGLDWQQYLPALYGLMNR